MNIVKPKANTKVRITVDNTVFTKTSCVWQPATYAIEGVVYYSNPWDDESSVTLKCENQPMEYPIIPFNRIVRMDVFENDAYRSFEMEIDAVVHHEIESYTIESSKKGEYYRVSVNSGVWQCNCVAGLMNKVCKHIKQAKVIAGVSD